MAIWPNDRPPPMLTRRSPQRDCRPYRQKTGFGHMAKCRKRAEGHRGRKYQNRRAEGRERAFGHMAKSRELPTERSDEDHHREFHETRVLHFSHVFSMAKHVSHEFFVANFLINILAPPPPFPLHLFYTSLPFLAPPPPLSFG